MRCSSKQRAPRALGHSGRDQEEEPSREDRLISIIELLINRGTSPGAPNILVVGAVTVLVALGILVAVKMDAGTAVRLLFELLLSLILKRA